MREEYDMEENYNDYLEYYQSQDKTTRKDIILEQLKMLDNYANEMCKSINVNPGKLSSYVNLKKINDYNVSVITYINSIQDSLNVFNEEFDNLLSRLTGFND